MRHEDLVLAVVAADLHLQTGLVAAALHGHQRAPLIGVELAAILGQKVALEVLDDGGEADHLTFP